MHPFREGNGRSQREFIEELAKVNGINLDLTQVSKMDMIVASHEAINGHNDKLHSLFISNAEVLAKDEQLYYIDLYCSKEIFKEIMELIN